MNETDYTFERGWIKTARFIKAYSVQYQYNMILNRDGEKKRRREKIKTILVLELDFTASNSVLCLATADKTSLYSLLLIGLHSC